MTQELMLSDAGLDPYVSKAQATLLPQDLFSFVAVVHITELNLGGIVAGIYERKPRFAE